MSILAQTALSSARFAGRRVCNRFTDPHIDTLIIDVDRTLTTEDSPKLALEKLVGRPKTHEIFDSYLMKVLKGRMRVEELHGAIFGELYSRGFKRSDWVVVMEELERTGGLKQPLIDMLLDLSRRHGLTLVLATRASFDSAQWLAERFGFHHAIGSVERVNGSFQGFDTVIGAFDDGNGTLTKLSAASRAMSSAGKALDPSRTAVIANDLLDALEMLNCARGILLLPANPNRLERLTSYLRLYDVMVNADDLENIPPALGLRTT